MKLAVLLLALGAPHWVHTKTPERHLYVNRYGNVLGEYHRSPGRPAPWTAQCYERPVHEFATAAEARAYVLTCEVW